MKVRNKEKVHPYPSSSSAPPPLPPNAEAFSVMNLLPAAILALVSILSLQDREVLSYMITRSMKSTNPATVSDEKKKTQKKSGMPHKPSVFDLRPSKKVKGKKRHKSGRFDSVRFADTTSPDGNPGATAVSQPENNVMEVASAEEDARETSEDVEEEVAPIKEEAAVAVRGGAAVSGHKGLARKDVDVPVVWMPPSEKCFKVDAVLEEDNAVDIAMVIHGHGQQKVFYVGLCEKYINTIDILRGSEIKNTIQ
ncbi:hypothetical protein RJ640_017904 [Escallonia rubra]|uniref:Uncharacterized protein n=1 Tax=Escallonia rubra TaxID=112253 RepID=A0AA88U5N6_9ASTE|nr:hypothetical protein RJ640_017904 [Escallonia rubra]